ncbi:MAG: ROK family protein [Candidatus Nanosalina sp.]
MAFLCIDIGGTNTLFGVGNGDFQVVEKMRTERFLDDIDAALDEAMMDLEYGREDIEQVAIAAAGPIDREEKVFYPPNFFPDAGLEKVELGELFEDVEDVKIVNDCTSAVIGEFYYGEHDVENLVYVTISSGIGAGVILNGNVIEAADGNFGEVGHMKLGEELECGCGAKGHWEAYCSGRNLPEMAEKLFNAEFEDAKKIFEAYESFEAKAEKTIAEMHEMNAAGIANISNMFNPEKIVLGGAVPLNHPKVVVKPLKDQLEEHSVNRIPEIELCDLGERSVLQGLRAVCNGKYKPGAK